MNDDFRYLTSSCLFYAIGLTLVFVTVRAFIIAAIDTNYPCCQYPIFLQFFVFPRVEIFHVVYGIYFIATTMESRSIIINNIDK